MALRMTLEYVYLCKIPKNLNNTQTQNQNQTLSTLLFVARWGFLSKWGGKKEADFLTNLQTCLVLNTFRQNIKIVQLHKNSYKLLRTPSWLLQVTKCQEYNLSPRENSLLILSKFYILATT